MKSVLNFLVELGQDAALRARFATDAESLIAERKLSEGDRLSLMSGDGARVHAAAGVPPASLPPKIVGLPGAFAAA
jgi:hypothetical protein